MRWRDAKQSAGYDPDHSPEGGESWVHVITRFWITLLVIYAIIHATIIVVGQSDGFRAGVRNRLEAATGLSLELERVRVGLTLRLHLQGLRETGLETPRLEVAKAVLAVRLADLVRGAPWPLRSVELNGLSIRFVRDKDGVWGPFPMVADALLPWLRPELNRAEEFWITEMIRSSGIRFDVRDSTLTWSEVDEAVAGLRVAGISWRAAQVRPLDETVLWSDLRIQSVEMNGEAIVQDLTLEWLRLPDKDVLINVNQPVFFFNAAGP